MLGLHVLVSIHSVLVLGDAGFAYVFEWGDVDLEFVHLFEVASALFTVFWHGVVLSFSGSSAGSAFDAFGGFGAFGSGVLGFDFAGSAAVSAVVFCHVCPYCVLLGCREQCGWWSMVCVHVLPLNPVISYSVSPHSSQWLGWLRSWLVRVLRVLMMVCLCCGWGGGQCQVPGSWLLEWWALLWWVPVGVWMVSARNWPVASYWAVMVAARHGVGWWGWFGVGSVGWGV